MIDFKSIKVQNFLSIGNKPITISLNTHKITCVSGENGTAKSSLCIDSIFYALYGKAFRKVGLSKLINSRNKKDLLVELEFSIDNNSYRIKRGMKPNIFQIYENNKLIKEMANVKDYQNYLTTYILKMDEKAFKQLIIIGSTSYTPFMLLTTPERRVVIEQLLQIDIFSSMSMVMKQFVQETNSTISELNHSIELLNVKVEMQKKLDKEKLIQYDSTIEDNKSQIQVINLKKKSIDEEYVSIIETIDKQLYLSNKEEMNQNSSSLEKLNTSKIKNSTILNSLYKEKDFFSTNTVCPRCTQSLDSDTIKEKIKMIDEECTKQKSIIQQIENKYTEIQEQYNKNLEILNEFSQKLKKVDSLKKEMDSLQQQIDLLNTNIIHLLEIKQKEENEVSEDICSYENELQELNQKLEDCKNHQKAEAEILLLLKDDGIKSLIIKNYLPIINYLIAKYIELIEFDVQFELNENFEESFKSIHKENFTYNNLSEGERMRIDIALLFTFREIAKLRSSTATNLLILDEYERGVLDQEALTAMSNLLTKCTNENIIIISHSSEYYNAISDRIIKCTKKNGYAQVEIN